MNNGNLRLNLQALRRQSGHVHPRLGDLLRPDCVVMNGDFVGSEAYQSWAPYMVHLSVTGRCNAHCQGCINSCITFSGDVDREHLSEAFDLKPDRDARAVYELLQKDGADTAVVCFYGGEPLLLPEKIAETIRLLEQNDRPSDWRYMIYTNGLLLDKAAGDFKDLFSKLWLLSVSIDGRAEQHNRIRTGTDLETIHHNLKSVRPLLNGSVLMWSTLRPTQSLWDCFEEFLNLDRQGLADHWFWHWVEAEQPFTDFETYCRDYERDLERILDVYVRRLSAGQPLSIIHLDELVLFFLTGTARQTTGCGVEARRNYDLIGGRILACADLGMEWAMGRIDPQGRIMLDDFSFDDLIEYKRYLGCTECGVHDYCGGRCPVQALNSSAQRLLQYCQLMRLHVGIVQQFMPRIQAELLRQNISPQQLYDRSAVLAQFTDVTP